MTWRELAKEELRDLLARRDARPAEHDRAMRAAAALRHSHKDCGCPLKDISTEDVIEVVDEWERQGR